MNHTPPILRHLIQELSRLPGLGSRSGRRVALHLLKDRQKMTNVMTALESASLHIQNCPLCGNLDEQSPCFICRDPHRDDNVLCIVETVGDLWAIERAQSFKGKYHVLGGTLSALEGRGPESLKLSSLQDRLNTHPVKEIILALNPTLEGQTTTHFILDEILDMDQGRSIKVTHLAYGIPMGGELDYLDANTLKEALKERRHFN